MELKRYVRTIDNRIFILKENGCYAWLLDNYRVNTLVEDNHVFKTADTILELAQVGDMVEVYFSGNNTYSKQEIIEKNETSIKLSFQIMTLKQFYGKTYNHEMKEVKNAIAFWVRQDDDTFKRYPIEKGE